MCTHLAIALQDTACLYHTACTLKPDNCVSLAAVDSMFASYLGWILWVQAGAAWWLCVQGPGAVWSVCVGNQIAHSKVGVIDRWLHPASHLIHARGAAALLSDPYQDKRVRETDGWWYKLVWSFEDFRKRLDVFRCQQRIRFAEGRFRSLANLTFSLFVYLI